METIMRRVQKALQTEFSPKEIVLESASGGKVGGWVISKSFEGLTGMERQKKVWKLFDMFLNEKDRDRIVGFFTFTPLEKKIQFDEGSEFMTVAEKKPSSKTRRLPIGRKNGRVGQKRRLIGARSK